MCTTLHVTLTREIDCGAVENLWHKRRARSEPSDRRRHAHYRTAAHTDAHKRADSLWIIHVFAPPRCRPDTCTVSVHTSSARARANVHECAHSSSVFASFSRSGPLARLLREASEAPPITSSLSSMRSCQYAKKCTSTGWREGTLKINKPSSPGARSHARARKNASEFYLCDHVRCIYM